MEIKEIIGQFGQTPQTRRQSQLRCPIPPQVTAAAEAYAANVAFAKIRGADTAKVDPVRSAIDGQLWDMACRSLLLFEIDIRTTLSAGQALLDPADPKTILHWSNANPDDHIQCRGVTLRLTTSWKRSLGLYPYEIQIPMLDHPRKENNFFPFHVEVFSNDASDGRKFLYDCPENAGAYLLGYATERNLDQILTTEQLVTAAILGTIGNDDAASARSNLFQLLSLLATRETMMRIFLDHIVNQPK